MVPPFLTYTWSHYAGTNGVQLSAGALAYILSFLGVVRQHTDQMMKRKPGSRVMFIQHESEGLYDPRDASFVNYQQAVGWINSLPASISLSQDSDWTYIEDDNNTGIDGNGYKRWWYNGAEDSYIKMRVEKYGTTAVDLDITKTYCTLTSPNGSNHVYRLGGPFEDNPLNIDNYDPSILDAPYRQVVSVINNVTTYTNGRAPLIWFDHGILACRNNMDNLFRLLRLNGVEIDLYVMDTEAGILYWNMDEDQRTAVFTDTRWSTQQIYGTNFTAAQHFNVPTYLPHPYFSERDIMRFNADTYIINTSAITNSVVAAMKKWYPETPYTDYGNAGVLKQDATECRDFNNHSQYYETNDLYYDKDDIKTTVLYSFMGSLTGRDARYSTGYYNTLYQINFVVGAIRYANFNQGDAVDALPDMAKLKLFAWTCPLSMGNNTLPYWEELNRQAMMLANPMNTLYFNAGDSTQTDGDLYDGIINELRENYVGNPQDQQIYIPAVMRTDTVQNSTFYKLSGGLIAADGGYQDLAEHAPSNAIDGNLATHYAGTWPGAWIGLDFATREIVKQVKYCPRVGQSLRMVNATIRVADEEDFADEITIGTITTEPPEGILSTLSLTSNNLSKRFVRLVTQWGDVAELEFYTQVNLPTTNKVNIVRFSAPGYAVARELPNNVGVLYRVSFAPGIDSLKIQNVKIPNTFFTISRTGSEVGVWHIVSNE